MSNYKECHCCHKPSSYIGKLYWFENQNAKKLLCKSCLIDWLLKSKVISDNWYTNC